MDRIDTRSRARIIGCGVWVTLAAAGAVALYALATPEQPHRPVLLVAAGLALLDAALIWSVRDRIARSRQFAAAMMAWNCGHGVVIAVACALDGGVHSPIAAMYFLCVAFAGVSLGTRVVVAVAALQSVALVSAAIAADRVGAELALVVALLLVTAGVCAAVASDRERRLVALRASEEELLHRLVRVVEFRDSETGDHIERMSRYANVLAEALGHPAAGTHFRLASTLHDIGKVAVPDSILLKPGKLTATERAVMERHAELGHEMLLGSDSEILRLGAEIALTHHERWDGGGYPAGLATTEIPLSGRIVAVADTFDALTSDRVYRKAVPIDDAVAVIAGESGRQFDPTVVEAFLRSRDELEAIHAASRAASGHRSGIAATLLAA